MKSKIILAATALLALSACGKDDGASAYLGTWQCNSAIGQISFTIRQNGDGDDYIAHNYPVVGKLPLKLVDGKMEVAPGQALTIDADTGKMIFPGVCELDKV